MANLTAIRNKLNSLRQQKDSPSNDIYYLFDTMPTLHEWKQATDVSVGSRGKTNPEILQIDNQLLQYQPGPYKLPYKGIRAKAIREIRDIIGRWKLRRGSQANTSERYDAMQTMEEIVDTLCNTVVYDRVEWRKLQRQYSPTGPNLVPGGYGEEGPTVEEVRQFLIDDMYGPGRDDANYDSMNEASYNVLDTFGLRPGSRYSGGAACYSGPHFAVTRIHGSVTRYTNETYQIKGQVKFERNARDTHRYNYDANGIIIDTTWRQHFRHILGRGTPGIFVGTLKELRDIVVAAGADPHRIEEIYSGTIVKEKYDSDGNLKPIGKG